MKHITESKSSAYSYFGTDGNTGQFFIAVLPKEDSLEHSLKVVYDEYVNILKANGLSAKTEFFRRFYGSDIANQKDIIAKSKIFGEFSTSATSMIQQCPLHGGPVAFFAYHIKSPTLKKEPLINEKICGKTSTKIHGSNYELMATANISDNSVFDSEKQTKKIFNDYDLLLKANKYSFLQNTIRTWIYVRDIDNHYKGMVKARREFFAKNGLTKETRYIASTGIEGKTDDHESLVSMDALSIAGLDQKQIVRIEARNHLSPTYEYGVTFERGTKVDFGDRSHLYISGTASIDKDGHVVHLLDIEKQTRRVLENITALLAPHGATIKNMAYLIVYVRNITEIDKVSKILKDQGYSKIPTFYLEGAVCRPEWLVEIEGEAIIKAHNDWPIFS